MRTYRNKSSGKSSLALDINHATLLLVAFRKYEYVYNRYVFGSLFSVLIRKNCFRFTAIPLLFPGPITVRRSILSPCYVLPPVVPLLLAMIMLNSDTTTSVRLLAHLGYAHLSSL